MSPQLLAALTLAAQAFVVGLSGAMSPGPYLTVTIARTVQRGAWSAGLMLVGHGLLEAALLVGFAFGLQRVLRAPSVALVLAVLGGAVLLLMGFTLAMGAVRGTVATDLEVSDPGVAPRSRLGAVGEGAIVSASNPWWVLWWATIGVKLAADGLAIGPAGVAAFYVGHQLADVSWYGLVIALVHRGKSLLTPRVYRAITGVLGVLLAYLGARFVGQAFGIELPWLPV